MDAGHKSKILVADDRYRRMAFLTEHLMPHYSLFFAASGEEILIKAKEIYPDLIIIGLLPPDTASYTLLADLKGSDVTYHIPVIVISELDSVEVEVRCLSLGAEDFISKPFHPSVVRLRVEKCLQTIKHIRTVEMLGHVDVLTGLLNRRGFNSRVTSLWGMSIRERSPVSILMIDVDDFKLVNDTYGHVQGDLMLQAIGDTLAKALRRPADIAARWGGEEFAVLLPNTNSDGALLVAENIRASVANISIRSDPNRLPMNVTLSIGIASTTPLQDNMLSDFIMAADKAMYAAKLTGKNKVCPHIFNAVAGSAQYSTSNPGADQNWR